MFDEHARSLFRDFPEFEGLSRESAAQALSAAYLSIIRYRVNGSEEEGEQLEEAPPYLRRLANTLIFHVILRDDREQSERQAAAFVAAEAIALMADHAAIDRRTKVEQADRIRSSERFARVEAALLYLFAQYDACAGGVLSFQAPPIGVAPSLQDRAQAWCFARLEQLCRLRLYPELDAAFPFTTSGGDALSAEELESDTVARLYRELGRAASDFAGWLSGEEELLATAIGRLDSLRDALMPKPVEVDSSLTGYGFSRIFHLATLLRLSLPSLGERALLHVIPNPPSGDPDRYRQYLQERAVGSATSAGRPVLWPSALGYVRECILGDARHAVASMPTGSGKSFIAELAVSQAVGDGWVLYLAPTNALTKQIRRDLRQALEPLETEVFAFIGDREYSILAADRVDQMPVNSVAVMTPEKCALALRLSPEVFENCRLLVFDECHLLGESSSSRGPVAELVLTQLMLRVPNCRFLLMSAIIQNPEELAGWIAEATSASGKAVTVRWRPTRTLRTVLGVDNRSFQRAAKKARKRLKRLPDRRKNLTFTADCAVAASLSGAWQSESQPDYTVIRLDCDANLSVSRKQYGDGKWRYAFNAKSWVNDTATNLATKLAERGIQTLVFTPASKHYPFSNAKKVLLPTDVLSNLPTAAPIVETCEVLAEYELGCKSQVFELLANGIAVHTSLMLETEKIGSEAMFRGRSAPIMFATGTLAQGLNLPAIAVVIAGSRIGDPRGQEQELVQRRKFSQLLNAAGRAGRAGFANQGLVVAVPDNPVVFQDFDDVLSARQQVDYLQQNDDSVTVESGLTRFLDLVCAQALRQGQASDTELQVISLLAGGDKNQLDPQPVLQRTFAAYLRRKAGKSDVTPSDAEHLVRMGKEFIEQTGAPPWLTVAAQRAGLGFFLTLGVSQAWGRVRPELEAGYEEWSVMDWTEELIRLIAHVPPGLLAQHLPDQKLKYISEDFRAIAKDHAQLFYTREFDWKPPKYWLSAWQAALNPLRAWMEGKALIEIASLITGQPNEDISPDRTQGKAIPKALSVTGDSWSALALIAGGFLAIAEQVLDGDVPLPLACLPMCIKYGCDSPETLAWFRFGVRLRRPARLLSNRFPPPPAQEDETLKSWVRSARRDWIKSQIIDSEDPDARTLRALRAFITN